MATRTAFRSITSRPVLAAAALTPLAYVAYNRSFTASAAADAPAQPTKVFATTFPGFVSLKLQSAEQVNHDTKRLRFELPNEGDVSGVSVISAVLTKASINGAWIPTVRPYSPISDPEAPGHVDFLVKRYADGPMSTHLHSLQPGQTHSFMTKAISEYAWTPNAFPHVVLIAGGAGITPLYQLAKQIFKDPADKSNVTMVFGVNTDEDLLFKEEFEEMESSFPERFRVVYTVTKTAEGSGNRKGRVTKELLKEVIPAPQAGLKVFMCGPDAMTSAIAGPKGKVGQGKFGGVLQELGYTQDQVHKL